MDPKASEPWTMPTFWGHATEDWGTCAWQSLNQRKESEGLACTCTEDMSEFDVSVLLRCHSQNGILDSWRHCEEREWLVDRKICIIEVCAIGHERRTFRAQADFVNDSYIWGVLGCHQRYPGVGSARPMFIILWEPWVSEWWELWGENLEVLSFVGRRDGPRNYGPQSWRIICIAWQRDVRSRRKDPDRRPRVRLPLQAATPTKARRRRPNWKKRPWSKSQRIQASFRRSLFLR